MIYEYLFKFTDANALSTAEANGVVTGRPAVSRLQVPDNSSTRAQKNPSDRMAATRKNVFKTLLTVTICFIVCWIWNSVYVLAYLTGADIKMSGPFYVLTVYAAFCNCIINPFIYCIQYKPFQGQALKLIGGRLGRGIGIGISRTSDETKRSTVEGTNSNT